MTDIAKLGIEIDSSSVKQSSKELKTMSAQARGTETIVGRATRVISTGFTAIAAAAAAGTAAISAAGFVALAMVNKQADAIDKMYKQASNLRIELGEFQRLTFIAEQSGNSVEQLSSTIDRMNRTLAQGTPSAVAALSGIGLSIDQLMRMRPDQRFEIIAKAIRNTSDESAQLRAQFELFGRSGGNMLNLINADFDQLNDKFERMGVRLTNAQGDMVAAYQDAKHRLSTLFTGFQQQFTAQMAGPLTQIVEWVEEFTEGMGGMDTVAARAASGVISALATIVESGASMLEFINDVLIGFKQIQLFDMEFRKRQVAIAGSLGFAVDESVFSEYLRLEREIEQLRARGSSINDGADRMRELSQSLLDTIGRELPSASNTAENGLSELGAEANRAAQNIGNMLTGTNSAWEKIFGSQAQEGKQRDYIPESFADSARKFASAMERNDNYSMEVYARDMQRLIESSQGRGVDFSGKNASQGDTMGMIEVMNRLLDKTQAQNQKVNVDLNLTTDRGQLKGEIIASPEMARAMQEIAKRTVNETARQVLA
jgi:hypothetical protein